MFYTYIVASKRNGTLYTGSTDSIVRRGCEHREKLRAGFTATYGVSVLVWFEPHDTREAAVRRERQIKEMAPRLEAAPDRGEESDLARSL